MKPTVVLLCGLPYAGKSTIAQALAKEGFARISLDDINEERGLPGDEASIPGFEWLETHRIGMGRLETLVRQGRDVVWDDTNYAAWIRDPIFEAVISFGGEPIVVFVDTPVEEVKRRSAIAAQISGRTKYTPEDFDRVLRDFDPPCCGLRTDGTLSVDHTLAPVRRAIQHQVLQ